MNTRLLKQFESQFGENWSCACGTALDPSRFEIMSETLNTILVHYLCPVCGKEQMLAASASEQSKLSTNFEGVFSEGKKFYKTVPLSSDDILDIRSELKKFRSKDIRALFKKSAKGVKVRVDNYKWKN